MRKLWCFTLLFMGYFSLIGQQVDHIDQLKTATESTADTTKFQSYIDLSFAYTSRNMDSAFIFSSKALALLPVLEEEKYRAAAYNSVAILHYYQANYESAQFYFHEALLVNQELSRMNGVAINYTQIGSTFHMQNRYDSAIVYQRKAMEIYEYLHDTSRYAAAALNLGSSLENKGYREETIDLYLKALTLNQLIGNQVNEIKVLKRLGGIYKTSNQNEEAKRIYQEAIQKAEAIGDLRMLAYLNTSIGSIYFQESEMDSAKDHYLKSLHLHEKIRKKPNRIISFHLGKIAQIEKDISGAIGYYQEAYHLAVVKKDSLNLVNLAIELARCYAVSQDQKGVLFLEKAQAVLMKKNFQNFAIEGLNEISKTYEEYGLYKEALTSFMRHKSLSDSLLSEEFLRKIDTLKQENQVFRKEQIIKQLEAGKEASEAKKNLYFILFLLVVTITAALIWSFFYRKRKNDQLNRQKQLLAEERIKRLKMDLQNYTDQLIDRNRKIDSLLAEVNELKEVSASIVKPALNVAEVEELTQGSILTNDEWKLFKKKFNSIHPSFFDNLHKMFSEITNAEEKIFTLSKLHLSNHEIADMLGISSESVKVSKYRLRKKLNLNKSELKEIIHKL